MDQLLAMRAFVRIVESGTFAKAAAGLKLPRTSVTRLMQSLEKHLGVQLLRRTTRKVSPTPEGLAYYERALALLVQVDELDSEIGGARTRARGRLRVETGSALANLIVIPALPDFQARYPGIQLELSVSDRRADLIGDGFDCVIRGGALSDTSHRARKLGELPVVTCASPAYVKANGAPRHPDDLRSGHRVVGYANSSLVFERGTERIELRGPGVTTMTVNEGTAHITALRVGLGIGQMIRFMASDGLADGSLVEVLPEWKRPAVPVHLLTPANAYPGARVRAFSDWMAALFKKPWAAG